MTLRIYVSRDAGAVAVGADEVALVLGLVLGAGAVGLTWFVRHATGSQHLVDYEGRSWWSAISYQSKRTRSMTANCRIGRRELAEGDATPLLP